MLSPILRRATVDDIDALVPLRVAMQTEVKHDGGAPPDQMDRVLRDYFNRAIPSEEFIAYVAEIDGKIVATSGMVFHRSPPSGRNGSGVSAYIMNMYTLPAHRGAGLAKSLLGMLLEEAKRRDIRYVSLNAVAAAQPIYRAAGFVLDESQMRLDLLKQ